MSERRLMLKIAGEIGTKSARTRRKFLSVLAGNVRAALARAGVAGNVRPAWSRLLVDTAEPDRGRAALERVFGLHSVSEVATVRFGGLDDLVDQVATLRRDDVAGRTFAVRPRRAGEHPFSSQDLARALGTALLPASAGVDLDDPEVEVRVEIVDDVAHVVLGSSPGAGGLPIGSGGRAVALFSGGFDSPVAAWMTMRRGAALDLVVCDLGGCGQVDAALMVARALAERWAPGREPATHVVDLVPLIAALRSRVEPRIRQVVLKRAMYRAGTLVARSVRADALVTGESLGQVSTQTLRNLVVAEQAAGVPVLRPLVGMDKEEILGRARAIGTHDSSRLVQEHCSISTGRVETAARLRDVITAEGGVDDSFIREAVAGRLRVDLPTWTPGPSPEHVVQDVPAGAVIVDVREPDEGPGVGDVRLPFSEADRWAAGLDEARTYLFVCTAGERSEIVAHELHERGLSAFSLAGGVANLPTAAA